LLKEFSIKSRNIRLHGLHGKTEKSQGTVLYFHGLLSSTGLPFVHKVAEEVNRNNLNFLTFDYTGHGKSGGSLEHFSISGTIEDTKAVIEHAKSSRLFLIGYSIGTYPAIIEASKNKNVQGVVLLNPAVDFVSLTLRHWKKIFSLKIPTVSLMARINFVKDIAKYNLYMISRKIRCPIFVFHALEDKVVPPKQSVKLDRHLSSKKKFVYIPGAGHELTYELLENSILPSTIEWAKQCCAASSASS
jgi:uncharacterized protein